MKTTTNNKQKTKKLNPILTNNTPIPKLTNNTTFSKLKKNSKPNQNPIKKTKKIITKKLSTTTIKNKIFIFFKILINLKPQSKYKITKKQKTHYLTYQY